MALPSRSLVPRLALVAGLGSLGALLPPAGLANTGVTITSYGHSALLIQGGGATVLVNPFRAVGCAAGLAEPRVSANVVLASSQLLDEGAPVASGRLLTSPGSYRIAGLRIEGVAAPHDRFGGRRFGQSTLWRWKQGGLEIAHLGGTAAQLTAEDRVLLGNPGARAQQKAAQPARGRAKQGRVGPSWSGRGPVGRPARHPLLLFPPRYGASAVRAIATSDRWMHIGGFSATWKAARLIPTAATAMAKQQWAGGKPRWAGCGCGLGDPPFVK